jgi:hypothetical protein
MNPSSSVQPKAIQISPRKVATTLALIWSVMVFYGTLAQFTHLYYNFNLPATQLTYLDTEMNLPAIFSGFMLLVSSIILGLIWNLEKKLGNAKYWLVLTVGFFYLSMDEVFQIHEKTEAPMHEIIGNTHLGFFTFVWIIPYVIIVIFVGSYFLKFLFSLPKEHAKRFIIAGIFYVGAVIGMEGITSMIYAHLGSRDNFTYLIPMTIEEAGEMYSIIFFIFALLKYIQQTHRGVTISLE